MDKINKNKGPANIQPSPRVKIYYLRNDSSINTNMINQDVPLVGPSLSCLSSLLQKQKESFTMPGNQLNYSSRLNFEVQSGSRLNQKVQSGNNEKTPQISERVNKSQDNQIKSRKTHLYSNRISHTAEIKELQNLRQIHEGHYNPHHKLYKRLIKTSQQKYAASYKQSDENQSANYIQKQFLSSIVSQWNTYHEESKQRNRQRKGRALFSSSSRRKYSESQVHQMLKNKSLMKEHFNLFLEDQNKKKTSRKKPSLTHLKAIFQREEPAQAFKDKEEKHKMNTDQNLTGQIRNKDCLKQGLQYEEPKKLVFEVKQEQKGLFSTSLRS